MVIGPIIALAARLLEPGGSIAVEHDDTTSQRLWNCFVRQVVSAT